MRHGRTARGAHFALAALVLAIAVLGLAGCGRRVAPVPVLILGVDSADWEMILPMVERGELPTFARLLDEGASAPCRTLHPTLSPLLWTSIATGRNPDEHGILDFVTRDPRTGRLVPVTSTLRRVKALWNIASEAGRRVGIVGWLASWPAEEVNGILVTDRLAFHPFDAASTGGGEERIVFPADRTSEIRALMTPPRDVPFDSLSRFLSVSRETYDAAPFDAYRTNQHIGNFRRTWAAADGYRRVTKALLAQERWDLFLAYFEFLDATSHLFVRHMPPALADLPEEEKAAFGGVVEEAYRWQDRVLGEILALAGEEAVVLVVSDHGFLLGERRIATPSEVLGGEAAEWHRDEGILIAWGQGVRRGVRLPPVSILDVAPTILWLQGLPVSAEMPGRPIVGAFDERFTKARPMDTVETYETEERETGIAAGEEDEAIRERLQALGYLASEGANEVVNRAIFLRERGDIASATKEWERAKALAPSRVDVAIGLGFTYYLGGRPDEARREWERALALDPKATEANINLGNLAYEAGRLAEAAERYRAAIGSDSLAADAYVNLGQVYLDQERFADAVEVLGDAKMIAPGNAGARLRLGIAFAEMGSAENAMEELKRAMELDRNLKIPVGIWIGRVLEGAGELDEAIEQFETVVRLAPNDLDARLSLGRAYLRAGRGERAGITYVEVLRLDPANEEAKKALDALARSAPGRSPAGEGGRAR